jgi:pyruvate formate lyase activating enzyme
VSRTSGVVFDIQHYAVHDGPGIRTLVFLKGCPLRCAWCCNPESQAPQPVLRRFPTRCQACLRCASKCPQGAIRMEGDVVVLDRRPCTRCEEKPCVTACSSQALAVSGKEMDVEAVVARVAADRNFYRNSGGGVTFSGGEPFVQGEFLMALLAACRQAGIHTAVETSGYVDAQVLLAAEPLVDLFLFDMKSVDPERHRLLTGATNEVILDTLAKLAARSPQKVILRVPLIPGLTDDHGNLAEIARLASRHRLMTVNLVPYHPLGRDKYPEVGLPIPPEVAPLTPSMIDQALALFAGHGLLAELA